MIKEDYVSFEVAKLLKEKGFDDPDGGDCECHMFYSSYSKMIMSITEIGLVSDFDEVYYAPTHQMAMKWLRDVHKLSIEPFYMFPAIWEIDIKYIDKKTDLSEFEDIRDKSYNSYEEAVEVALKYALENLI